MAGIANDIDMIKKAIRKDFHAGEHVFPFSLLESSFFEFI